MAIITITNDLEKNGPILKTEFNVPSHISAKSHNLIANALIDTGASHSIIKSRIPEGLGLKPVGETKINTASCKDYKCYQYFLKLVFPEHNLNYEGVFTALPLDGQEIDCLIGRDILKDVLLIYIGNINQFTISLK
ncbi:MAG: hypothetical protein WCX82_01080 [archaeon]|jgi:predicted aspartyl protease